MDRPQEYSLTGIFALSYIQINTLATTRMRGMRRGGATAPYDVSQMLGENVGMQVTTLSALAEPNRMDIVELLRDGPLVVGEIADRLGLRQPQASKHLEVLRDSGILGVTAAANRRIYKLRPEPFQALDAWLDSFRHVMEERFDNLDAYLRELQHKDDSTKEWD